MVPSSLGRGAFQILLYLPEFYNNNLNSFKTRGIFFLRTACKHGSFIWSYWVNIDVSLKGGRAFSINLPFPLFKVTNTSDPSVYLA